MAQVTYFFSQVPSLMGGLDTLGFSVSQGFPSDLSANLLQGQMGFFLRANLLL